MSATSDQLGRGKKHPKTRVYIAGPMRGYEEYNFPMFDYAKILGEKLGYEVISPADMDRDLGFDPATNGWTKGDLRAAVRRDLDVLQSLSPDRGDFVVVLPGHEHSAGASAELRVARWLGLSVRSALSFVDDMPPLDGASTFLGTAWAGHSYPVNLFLSKDLPGAVWTGDGWENIPAWYLARVGPESTPLGVATFLIERLKETAKVHASKTAPAAEAAEEKPTTAVGGKATFEKLLGEKLYGHPRFYEILLDMASLHSRKNHDYASTENPLSNFYLTLKMGIPSWKGVVVRLGDKWSRLAAFARTDTLAVKDEPIVDTFTDNAVYSILGRILFEELKKNAT